MGLERLLVVLVVCMSWTAAAQECPFFGNARRPETYTGLTHCNWFSKTCCRRTEVTSVFEQMPRLSSATVRCQQRMEYLRCYFCSPNQGNWYDRNRNQFIVCNSFCDTIYEHCRTSIYNGTTFSKLYPNGTEFCRASRFRTANVGCFSFDSSVFGGALNVSPYHSLIITTVVLTYLFLFSTD